MENESQSATAVVSAEATSGKLEELARELKQREAAIAALQADYARLWRSYEMLKDELALVRRRLFVATAERIDTKQLQLEFAELVKKLNDLSGQLPKPPTSGVDANDTQAEPSDAGPDQGKRKDRGKGERPKPTGRRNLEDANLPEVRVEVPDPLFEQLVLEGKAKRLNKTEDSRTIGYERGGPRCIVMARVKYVATDAQGETAIETAPKPPVLLSRCMAAPSVLAMIANTKFCDGVSLYQIEQMYDRWGLPIDRGTMSRWLEELGAAFGTTIIEAARKQAFANAFCIMTDATGFAIQPGPSDDGKRRPCRKGHYFVQIVDRDYMFFEFTPKETSSVVRAMFQGFGGYLQADAKSVYDVLFRSPEPGLFEDDEPRPTEVACWAQYLESTVIWSTPMCAVGAAIFRSR